eukprot:15475575-Alexandrium_andersonii.AAC.1
MDMTDAALMKAFAKVSSPIVACTADYADKPGDFPPPAPAAAPSASSTCLKSHTIVGKCLEMLERGWKCLTVPESDWRDSLQAAG